MAYQELVTKFNVTFNKSRAGKVAVVTMDNGENYTKPNTFGYGGLTSLSEAIDKINAEKESRLLQLVFWTGQAVGNAAAKPAWNPGALDQVRNAR